MTAEFAGMVVLLLLAGGTVVQRSEVRRAEQRSTRAAREVIAKVQEKAALQPRDSLLSLAREGKIDFAGDSNLVLLLKEGKIIWQSGDQPVTWPLSPDDWLMAGDRRGAEVIMVARPWEPIREDLRQSAENLFKFALIVTAVTTAFAWFIVGRTLSPIQKLAAQAKDASIESLQVKLHPPSSDSEMRHLTDTLNALLERLEREARGRGHFYAAASHELRTPIQVLLGKIDVALARPRSVEEYQELLVVMQRNTERLASLVQDLLQLNALEMSLNHAQSERINLRDWLEYAQEGVEKIVAERHLSWESDLADIEVVVPPAHFSSLIRNLCENAAKYATEGTTIKLTLKSAGNQVSIVLWNACGLPEGEDLSVWYEPFYRPADPGPNDTGGNGLGIPICAAIARSNNWNFSFQATGGGLRASLVLPKSATQSAAKVDSSEGFWR